MSCGDTQYFNRTSGFGVCKIKGGTALTVLTDMELFNVGIAYESNRGEDVLTLIEDALLPLSKFSFSDDLDGLVFPELKLIRFEDVLNADTGFTDHAVQMWWNDKLLTDYICRQKEDNRYSYRHDVYIDHDVATLETIDACVLYICGEIVKQRNV